MSELSKLVAPHGARAINLEGTEYSVSADGTVEVPPQHVESLVRYHHFTFPGAAVSKPDPVSEEEAFRAEVMRKADIERLEAEKNAEEQNQEAAQAELETE